MITFTDKRLYPKGICSAQLQDPVTGEILSQSDKFTTGTSLLTSAFKEVPVASTVWQTGETAL